MNRIRLALSGDKTGRKSPSNSGNFYSLLWLEPVSSQNIDKTLTRIAHLCNIKCNRKYKRRLNDLKQRRASSSVRHTAFSDWNMRAFSFYSWILQFMIHWLHYFIAYQHSMRIKWINMNGPAGFFYNLSHATIRFVSPFFMRLSVARHWWRQRLRRRRRYSRMKTFMEFVLLPLSLSRCLSLTLIHFHNISILVHTIALDCPLIPFYSLLHEIGVISTYKNCLLFWQMNAYTLYAAMKAIWCI